MPVRLAVSRWARRASIALLLLPALVGIARPVSANDSAVGGAGALVFPLDTTDVALVREVVRFEETKPGEFTVTAELTFRNDTEAPRALTLGFPLMVDDGSIESDMMKLGNDTLIDRFVVTAGGVAVKPTLIKNPAKFPSPDGTWNAIYTFPATFPPHAETTVSHRYALAAGRDSMGRYWIPYVFETGSRWKGAIERSEFVYRFRAAAPPRLEARYGDAVLLGAQQPLVAGKRTVAGLNLETTLAGGPAAELHLIFSGIKPVKNLEVSYDGAGPMLWPAPDSPPKPGADEIECGNAMAEFLADPAKVDAAVRCWDADFLRNALYAARGFAFQNAKWKGAFNQGLFHVSTEPFTESWFSPAEKAAIAKLKGMEKKAP